MSEQAQRAATENPEAVELPHDMGAAFSDLMDTLAPETDSEENEAGGTEVPADAGADGRPASPAETPGQTGGTALPPTGGDAGSAGLAPGAEGAPAGADNGGDQFGAGVGSVEYDSIQPAFGEVSVALEERMTKAHQNEALGEVQKDYAKYFETLRKHPRLLVGAKVPNLRGEGEETLRDAKDAEEWQGAVKALLGDEIRERAAKLGEGRKDSMRTLHGAIELFQNNSDLVPGTRQFDKELADNVMKFAKPYSVRVDGKLHGFSIDIQPLVAQEREALAAARTAAKAAPPPEAAPPAPVGRPRGSKKEPAGHAPQAGIKSQAGSSADGAEDFDELFATIGLRGMRV